MADLNPKIIEAFKQSLIARGRTDETVRAYCNDVREFVAAMHPVTADTFDTSAVLWLNTGRATWAPKTTQRRMTALRTFARLSKWPTDILVDYHAPDPGRPVPHPIPEGIPGVHRMIDASKNDRQAALIALCGLCGLRLSEALSIDSYSLSLDDRVLTVRGKGDKTRFVPVSARAFMILLPAYVEAAMHQCGVVEYHDRFARQIITDCGARAGLRRPVSSHDLRATFATAAYDKSLDLRAVQELLGHSSSKTTEGYTGISMDAMRAAADLS